MDAEPDVHYVTKKLNVYPLIDLFASRLNTQLPEFISYCRVK